MTQARNSGGFSFELSESAPPVQTAHHTPMGDLDLDLGEFKLNHPAPSPLPEAVLSVAPPVAEVHDPWPSSPFSPLLPHAEPQPDTAQRSEAVDPALPDASADSAELMFELAPAQPSSVAKLDSIAPASTIAVAPAAKLEPIALIEPSKASEPKLSEAVPSVGLVAEAKPAPTARSSTKSAAPAIKKIQFPAKRSVPAQSASTQSKPAPAPKSSPATRFSASISQKAPAVALSDRDSDPFLDGMDDGDKSVADGSGQDDQALPEDLPPLSPLASSAPIAAATKTWESETPTARELWHNARRAWHATSKKAATWSGHGLRSAQKVARNVHHKLQTRLETQAQAAQEPSLVDAAPQSVAAPRPTVSQPAGTQRSSAVPPMATAQTLFAEHSTHAGHAGSAQLRAAQRVGKRLLTKAAAPLCAIAAASVVYLAGSHFMGDGAQVSLSSSRWAGPAVPDLGSLPGAQERKPTRPESSGKPAPVQNKVAPMVSEITALPEGLSWPGKGLIEVVTSEDELIYIDGVFTGRGPLRRVPVIPGKHDVAIKTGGEERTGTVEVEAEKSTRAVFTGAVSATPAP